MANAAGGCLYVADWAKGGERGGRVWCVYPDGYVVSFLGDVDKPRKMSLNTDRLLLVSGDRLVVYQLPDGKVVTEVGCYYFVLIFALGSMDLDG